MDMSKTCVGFVARVFTSLTTTDPDEPLHVPVISLVPPAHDVPSPTDRQAGGKLCHIKAAIICSVCSVAVVFTLSVPGRFRKSTVSLACTCSTRRTSAVCRMSAEAEIGVLGLAVMGQVRMLVPVLFFPPSVLVWVLVMNDAFVCRILPSTSLRRAFPISVHNRSYEKTEAAQKRADKAGARLSQCSPVQRTWAQATLSFWPRAPSAAPRKLQCTRESVCLRSWSCVPFRSPLAALCCCAETKRLA